MRFTLLVTALMVTSALGARIPSVLRKAPIPGYKIVELQWEVETTPGAAPITLNGTTEKIIHQLDKINPTWEHDFKDNPSALSLKERDSDIKARHVTDIFCNTYYPARTDEIQFGINYLRTVPGRPYNGPGPGACSQVSCSWDASIWWCNDHSEGLYLDAFYHIANMAQDLKDRCKPDPWTFLCCFSGQIFESGGWNVIANGEYDC